jgi:hypothetical protein
VVIYFVVSNAVRIGQQALVTKLDFSPKALAAAEAKREARLAGKGDVVDVDSAPVERKGRNGRGRNGEVGGPAPEAASASAVERTARSSRGGGRAHRRTAGRTARAAATGATPERPPARSRAAG